MLSEEGKLCSIKEKLAKFKMQRQDHRKDISTPKDES